MATNFPTSLDSYTTKNTGDTIAESHVNNLQDAVAALEAKVGINSSAVISALDYYLKVRNTWTNNTTSVGLDINQTANGDAVEIDNDGTSHALYIHQDGVLASSKYALYLYSNAAQADSPLAYILQDNAASTQDALEIKQDGSGYAIDVVAGASNFQDITGTTITASTKFLVPNGSAAAPSTAFSSQTGTGFWYGGDCLQVSVKGVNVYTFDLSKFGPALDNTYDLAHPSIRWANVNSVKINGADIGFANGWKFREYPMSKEDLGKSIEWMKENANQGIQLIDDQENVLAVFHKNGNIYIKGKVLPLEKLEDKND